MIPARDEEGSIVTTVNDVLRTLREAGIDFEILIIDDKSVDGTAELVSRHFSSDGRVRLIRNTGRSGFGMAVRAGLQAITGDAVTVMMADASDAPEDLVRYYEVLQRGYDCAFGSRFIKGSRIIEYPPHKLILNRLANLFIRLLFGLGYNDTTNAFKCYRRHVIEGMQPLISPHFNLTVEMPLKAIVRGYSFEVIPISWTNRASGISKMRIKEIGSRYLFIVLYLWLEKYLSRGDYYRPVTAKPVQTPPSTPHA